MKRKLTNTSVKNARLEPDKTSRKLSDGGGLHLLVNQSGKYWRYNYRYLKKQKTLALGAYPEISLADARRMHEDARALLAQDIDPAIYKKTQLAKREELAQNSFEVIGREWYAKQESAWSGTHKERVYTTLEKNVFPYIGKRPITEIEPPEILALCNRVVERGAVYSAHKTKQICGQVFRYAVASGRAQRDPTPDLRGALPPVQTKHMATITEPQKVGELLRAISGYSGDQVTRLALQLLPRVFTRVGELRHAEWSEIDTEQALWTIPPEKMKGRRTHKVPLSPQVIDILNDARTLTGSGIYVFPSIRTRSRPMSENTINAALRRMGYTKEEITGHGFRSMASSLLNQMGYNPDAIEAQLSHVDSNSVRAAYNRAEYWEERITMMNDWAAYLDSLEMGAQVIPLRKAQ